MNKQNSIDSNNSGTITSPGVRRRLSKEKVIASKMIDMKKEKEDMLLSFENVPEESSETMTINGSPIPSHSPHPPQSNNTDECNHIGTMDDTTEFNRTGSLTGSGSPKNSRRKGEMSQKMLERLNLFSGGSGGSVDIPHGPASPLTSTPISSPLVLVEERMFIIVFVFP